jgi:neutral ceramidase
VGGVLGRTSALALVCALAPALAVPAHAAKSRVVDTSQRSVLRSGVLRVQVVAQRSGRLGVVARSGSVVIGRRGVRFARPGARTVGLRLTERGRAAVERCGAATPIVVSTGGGARATAGLRVDAGACNPRAPAPLRAGAASADITPPIGTPMFAYTARSGIANPEHAPDLAMQLVADPDKNMYAKTFVASRGIHTRVRARALVLQSARGKFALVQADLGGVPYALTQAVQRRIAGTGIDGERLLLSATHTHSSTGPIWPLDSTGYAALGGDLFDPRIFELTADGIAAAIIAADARLEPARAGFATVPVTDASSNRNFEPFQRNADVPRDEAAARAASIDPDLTVLRVDSRDGQPLGVWSNFAIHPTSFGDGNLFFSGDNAGFAERIAERQIAAAAAVPPRHDRPVVDVWTNANEGDISPSRKPRQVDGQDTEYASGPYAGAHVPGERVGEGIFRAWQAAGERMQPTLELDSRRAFIDFDGTSADGEPVGPVPVLGAGGITGPDGFCAPIDNLAGPGQGMKFPSLAGRGLVPSTVPVAVVRVGSLGVAAFPAEITRQMGARVRAAITRESAGTFERTVIAGLSNGYVSYTATPEEYDACHYEGSFTLFGRRQGARYGAFATALTQALVRGEPAPAGAAEPQTAGVGPGQVVQPRVTPDAGEVVDQPAAELRRRDRATFHWRGGDSAYDAPRGSAFVSVEHLERDGSWRAIATDDGFQDVTERIRDDGSWRETFQFADCDPLGPYRFHVRGRADRGDGPRAYETVSRIFELKPVTLTSQPPSVVGSVALVRALYPDPGQATLMATPRLASSGRAVLEVTAPGRRPRRVGAAADPQRFGYVAGVPAGSTVRVLSVDDGCGNSGT